MDKQPRRTWRTRCATKDKVNSHGHCDKCHHHWKNHNRNGCQLFSCVCDNKNYPIALLARWHSGDMGLMHGNRKRKRVI